MNPFASRYEAGLRDNSSGIAVTSSGTANTKGAYAELLASAAYDAQGFFVCMMKSGHVDSDVLVDIAVGAAASEAIIVDNLVGPGTGNADGTQFYIPIPIPAGTRVSARCQAVALSNVSKVGITLASNHPLGWSGGIITTYGADTSDSGGVSVDPGAVSNTKGAYSELAASLTYDTKAIIIAIGEQNNFVRSTSGQRFDIAVGAAGSEEIVIPDTLMQVGAAADHYMPRSFHFRYSMPAGTRVSLRAQASTTDAADRLFDAVLYGVS